MTPTKEERFKEWVAREVEKLQVEFKPGSIRYFYPEFGTRIGGEYFSIATEVVMERIGAKCLPVQFGSGRPYWWYREGRARCKICNGRGEGLFDAHWSDGGWAPISEVCETCRGTGEIDLTGWVASLATLNELERHLQVSHMLRWMGER